MMQWFRLYSRIIDDDKLRLLAFEDRWHFVALCCLKSEGLLDEPEGDLRTRRIAVKLGIQVRELDEIGRRLREVGLVDEELCPVAWDELQFRSDSANERVKRYREARKAKGLKAQWQPTKDLREAIYDRDRHSCVYCGSCDDLTIDHKVPEMHGGDHSLDNLQTACRRCNAQKRDLTDEEYRERLSGNSHVTLQKQRKTTDSEKETEELEANASCASGDALKPEHVVSVWNDEIAPALGKPKVRLLTPERRVRLKARIAGFTLADFREVIANIRASPFLRGDTGWHGFSFDWFTKKANFIKILEGNYNG